MAQLIIILERTSVNPPTFRYCLRATVPAARQAYFADPLKTSIYKNALTADITALRAGQLVERSSEFAVGTSTVAQVKAALVDAQAEFQARVNEDGEWNPQRYFGTSWDGSAWTNVVVA
jgi:hypothetical protein